MLNYKLLQSCKNGDFHLECDTDNSKWTQLDETGHKLRINKTNSSHNGLYRCTQNGNVLRIFSVEISGKKNNLKSFTISLFARFSGTESYPPPKVESLTWFSSNSSSLTEYTFLCNITSKPEPKVFWIKQCHGSICNLNYHNMCFCPMNITNDNALYNNDNTYLSKIKLINVREVDSGWYMCLAVTSFGKDFKNITINVQSLNIPTPASYSLLFLIPFVFILSPAVIWLCYYYNRKKKKRKQIKHNNY